MDVKLPPLGEGADSGTVVNLFVKEGDQIAKDQPILELENEKAVATIPSTAAGQSPKSSSKPATKFSRSADTRAERRAGAAAEPKTAKPKAAPAPKAKAPEPEQSDESAAEEAGQAETRFALTGVGPRRRCRPFASWRAIWALIWHAFAAANAAGASFWRTFALTFRNCKAPVPQPRAAAKTAGARPPKPARRNKLTFLNGVQSRKSRFRRLRQVIARRMTENWNAIPQSRNLMKRTSRR